MTVVTGWMKTIASTLATMFDCLAMAIDTMWDELK